MRGHPRWLLLGIGSALVGLALMAASLLSLIAFRPRGRGAGAAASLFFGFVLHGWLLGSAIVAALICAPDPARGGPPLWSIAALVLLPVTLIAGCEAGTGFLPKQLLSGAPHPRPPEGRDRPG
jgi:MFS family permease